MGRRRELGGGRSGSGFFARRLLPGCRFGGGLFRWWALQAGAFFQFGKNIYDAAKLGENMPVEVLKLLVFLGLFVGIVGAMILGFLMGCFATWES